MKRDEFLKRVWKNNTVQIPSCINWGNTNVIFDIINNDTIIMRKSKLDYKITEEEKLTTDELLEKYFDEKNVKNDDEYINKNCIKCGKICNKKMNDFFKIE